ncbi:MAG: PSD1 domain-containing protein [Planctomyces sp.]|nr:PSD1 domain-containing protein [Planctomyces sp.]
MPSPVVNTFVCQANIARCARFCSILLMAACILSGLPGLCSTSAFATTPALSSAVPASAEEPPAESVAADAQPMVDFSTQVAPIFQQKCVSCHGPEMQEGGLRLDQFSGLSAGGKSGPAIIPGKPEESPLISAIGYKDEALQMPPDEKLPANEVTLLTQWIAEGAAHPEGALLPLDPPPAFDVEEARKFWSFQPVQRPEVPETDQGELISSPIDSFVVQQLKQSALVPNGIADRLTLIRRATLDLTGLPPTPEEIDEFQNDTAPDAFARVVDRLLASPAYGERWARHWLDVVRYADSNGLDENIAHGNAWRYRDYIIASLNSDKPYDQMIREQIAGDIFANEEPDLSRRNDMYVATGFLAMGPKVLAEADQTKMLMDIIDEQIDTTGRTFLGMTLGCARCHNHKFDPIAQSDYYSMVGIFKSTYTMESLKTIARWHENSIATPDDERHIAEHQQKIDATKKEVSDLIAATSMSLGVVGSVPEDQFPDDVKKQLQALRDQQKQLESSVPVLPTAMGVKEGTPEKARINIRGSHLTLGRPVARGVPQVLQLSGSSAIGDTESGRRHLAEWLTDPANPLTARVMVNRVWRWHFGRGLVASTDNFGHLGEKPTNPQLLDWLASEFVRCGWSIKSLHRTIMLSQTYQRSGSDDNAAFEVDPANMLNWKFSLRRMEAEAIRDSVLKVSGLLDETRGGSMLHVGNREFLFNHTSKDETKYDSLRRSIYLPVIRNNLYDGFSLFDSTDCAVPNGDRATSTVASQSLYMMNSPLMLQAGKALAGQIGAMTAEDESQPISALFRSALGRVPTTAETQAVRETLGQLIAQLSADGLSPEEQKLKAWAMVCHSVLASNEFVYIR